MLLSLGAAALPVFAKTGNVELGVCGSIENFSKAEQYEFDYYEPAVAALSGWLCTWLEFAECTIAIGWLRGLEPSALLMLLPALLILAVTAWSLACICGILFTLFSDAQQIAEISLQALFYATPVIYMPQTWRQEGWLAYLVEFNPFTSLLELVRRPLLHGEAPATSNLLIAVGFMSVACGIAWWSLRRIERNLVLWL